MKTKGTFVKILKIMSMVFAVSLISIFNIDTKVEAWDNTHQLSTLSEVTATSQTSQSIIERSSKDIVLYQTIVRKGAGFSALNVVSQYYYKDSTSLGDLKVKGSDNFTSLDETSVCEIIPDGYCGSDRKISGEIASLTMNRSGDILITLSAGVSIDSLKIYYIIANKNPAQLFCEGTTGTTICDGAKKVDVSSEQSSNWRNKAKSSATFAYYGEGTANAASNQFSVMTNAATTKYYGFNVFNKMDKTYYDLANRDNHGSDGTPGAYVIIDLGVKYDGESYYTNAHVTEKNYTIFTEVGNATSSKLTKTLIRSSGNYDLTQSISDIAVLVAPSEDAGLTDQAAYRDFIDKVFNPYVRPITFSVIGIMFLVTGTMTVITIVKSSDEPEVRRGAIKRLIALFTGALVIFLVLIFFEPILSVVYGWFE